MRVCETRKRASYRSVAAFPAALWSMSLIPIGGSDLTMFHTCLSAWERRTTGLRRSELFALKWKDVDFQTKQIYVTRSIVQNVIGVCKTESSQKPVPAH